MTENTTVSRRNEIIDAHSSSNWSDIAALSPFGLLFIVMLFHAVI
jgi:hypothetical protein